LTVSANILLIDAERTTMARAMPLLTREGYQVAHAVPGQAALDTLHATQPDLVIVSVEPNSSGAQACGWHFCRQIAASLSAPLLLLLPDRDESTRVKALELGADDCMTRPVRLLELVARVRALLRRSRATGSENDVVRIDERLLFDRQRGQLQVEGEVVDLSAIESKIMACFLDHPNRILSHKALLTQVWGWEYENETDYLKVYVHHLRKKIEPDPTRPYYILTERGLGYRFQMP
jgi:DNA-binding response OmpR family regulator